MAKIILTILFLSLYLSFSSTQAREINHYVMNDESIPSSPTDGEQTVVNTGKTMNYIFDPAECRRPIIWRPAYCFALPPPAHHHHKKGGGDRKPMCKSVSHLIDNCGENFFVDEGTRHNCCNDVAKISSYCFHHNLKHTEQKLLSVVKRICSDFSHRSPPEEPKQPPPVSSPPPPAAEKASPPPAPPSQTPSSPPPPSPAPPKPSPSPPSGTPSSPPPPSLAPPKQSPPTPSPPSEKPSPPTPSPPSQTPSSPTPPKKSPPPSSPSPQPPASSPPKPSPPPQSPPPPPKQSPSTPSPPPKSPTPSPPPSQSSPSPPQPPSTPTPKAPSPPKESPPKAPSPPPATPSPSTPPPVSNTPPPADQPPHRRRPDNCLVSTVLYDSCDPKFPEADSKNASSKERNFIPQNLSTGYVTDAAGCCLGFAVFTNDCRPAIKDLSFARQKVFASLQGACGNPYP